MKKYIFFLITLLLVACHQAGQHETATTGATGSHDTVSIQYARNFTLDSSNPHMRLLTITKPESDGEMGGMMKSKMGKGRKHHGEKKGDAKKHHTPVPNEFRYALIDAEANADSVPEGYEPIRVPVSNFICMTSLQLSNFIALGQTNLVKGITSTRHLFNPQMQQQLQDGTTAQIGIEGNFDNEVIIAINPQLILVSPSKRGGYDVLRESGLPIMPHMGYQEVHPLGQAEWVKLIGLLTGHEREANERFDSIATNYHHLKELVADVQARPTVMSGDMKGGNWYATGGRSFLAQIFADAGATYFMHDNESTGGVNLDFETVYAQGADAEYWRISNSYDGEYDYAALQKEDSRFADFRAFRERHVIYCNMSRTPFYEAFPMQPDVVLADFIHIFHPELLPQHQPVFYSLLK